MGINYKEQCFKQVLQEKSQTSKIATGVPIIGSTQDWGVDVILDLVGASHFQKNIDSLVLEGRVLLVGTAGGVQTEIDSIGKVRLVVCLLYSLAVCSGDLQAIELSGSIRVCDPCRTDSVRKDLHNAGTACSEISGTYGRQEC